jgi:hypothetical protein
MTEQEKIISFKGHKLDYSGHVIGAFPSVDVIQQQTEEAIKKMTKNINQQTFEYCLKINIDPDVLLKQKAEIEMLLMKNDLLQEENKKLKESEVWHFVKDGDYPKDNKQVLCCLGDFDEESYEVGYYDKKEDGENWHFKTYNLPDDQGPGKEWGVSAWKKITGPEVK